MLILPPLPLHVVDVPQRPIVVDSKIVMVSITVVYLVNALLFHACLIHIVQLQMLQYATILEQLVPVVVDVPQILIVADLLTIMVLTMDVVLVHVFPSLVGLIPIVQAPPPLYAIIQVHLLRHVEAVLQRVIAVDL